MFYLRVFARKVKLIVVIVTGFGVEGALDKIIIPIIRKLIMIAQKIMKKMMVKGYVILVSVGVLMHLS